MTRRALLGACLTLLVTGCQHVLPWVAKAASLVDMVRSWLTKLSARADGWFSEHPDTEAEHSFHTAIGRTETALDAAAAVGRAGDAYSAADAEAVEAELVAAYTAVYRLAEGMPGFMGAPASTAAVWGSGESAPGTPADLEAALRGE